MSHSFGRDPVLRDVSLSLAWRFSRPTPSARKIISALGMSSRRLAAVRGWETGMAALPGPALAALVALPLGTAVMHLDHTNVPLPRTFALIPVGTVVVALVLATVAAVAAPRQGERDRRRE